MDEVEGISAMKMRFLALACLGSVCTAAAASSAVTSHPVVSEKMRPGVEKALEAVGKDIGKQKEDQKLLYMVLLLQSRHWDKVSEFYDANFTDKDPGGVLIQMALVQALEEKADFFSAKRVVSRLAKSTEASSLRARAHYMAGLSYHEQGEQGLDEAEFAAAIRCDPTFPRAYYELAKLAKNRQEKIANCAATLALTSPDSALARKAVALLLDELDSKKPKE